MTGEPTFLLGVGAQKAGTTWLHRQLERHPAASFGHLKEYHVFDALHAEHMSEFRMGPALAAEAEVKRAGTAFKASDKPEIWMPLAFQSNLELYFAYFRGLCGRAGVCLTGDLTPSYAALPEVAMDRIKRKAAEFGMKTQVLFLMRDPVERCLSMVRFHKTMLRAAGRREEAAVPDEVLAHRLYNMPATVTRANYPATLRRLRNVFAEEDILCLPYETLFTPETMNRLADWLRISRFEAEFESRVNASAKDDEVSEKTRAEIARFYAGSYAAGRAEFGDAFVAQHWPGDAFVPLTRR